MPSKKSRSQAVNANFSQVKVLIVDDNDDHWLLIKQAIQRCLPEVIPVRVATAEQVLALLDEWQYQEWELPKLIFLDLYLPQASDGWALLEQLKRLPVPLNQIPVLMLSASINPADIKKAYESGVSVYLAKPVAGEAWISYFQELRTYWWETVSLPPLILTAS